MPYFFQNRSVKQEFVDPRYFLRLYIVTNRKRKPIMPQLTFPIDPLWDSCFIIKGRNTEIGKYRITKTIKDMFSLVDLEWLNTMGMVTDHQIHSLIDQGTPDFALPCVWHRRFLGTPMHVDYNCVNAGFPCLTNISAHLSIVKRCNSVSILPFIEKTVT